MVDSGVALAAATLAAGLTVDVWHTASDGEAAVKAEIIKWIVTSVMTGAAFSIAYGWTQSALVAALSSVYAVIFGSKLGIIVNEWRVRRVASRAREQVQVERDGTTREDNRIQSRMAIRRDSDEE